MNIRNKACRRVFATKYTNHLTSHSHEYIASAWPVVVDFAHFAAPAGCVLVLLLIVTAVQVYKELS